jgi:hypothetical protein
MSTRSKNDRKQVNIRVGLFGLFGSKDPSPIHFASARECLKKQNVESDKAVDILARSLVIECQNLREFIFKNFDVYKSILIGNMISTELSNKGWLLPEKDAQPDFLCSQDECNAVDLVLSEFLETIGNCGKEASAIIKDTSPKRYKKYKDSGYSAEYRQEAWSVWIFKEQQSPLSPFLSIIANVIWNDKCKQKWEKEKKNVPAITQAVLVTTIKPLLTKETKIEITKEF